MYQTFTDARRVAVDYARRDGRMWHVIVLQDGYQVISELDRSTWYPTTRVLHTADPIFLGKRSLDREQNREPGNYTGRRNQ